MLEINKVTEDFFYNVFKVLSKDQWSVRSQVRSVSDNEFESTVDDYKGLSGFPITKFPFCVFKVSQPKEELGTFRIRGPFKSKIPFDQVNEDGTTETKMKLVSALPISNDLEFKIFYDSFDSIESIYEILMMNFSKFSSIEFKSSNFDKKEENSFKMSIKPDSHLEIDSYPSRSKRLGKEAPGQIYSLSFKLKRYTVIYSIPKDFSKLIEQVKLNMYIDQNNFSSENPIIEIIGGDNEAE